MNELYVEVVEGALYQCSQGHGLTSHDPAALVRLPAMNAVTVQRVASPDEFTRLLAEHPGFE